MITQEFAAGMRIMTDNFIHNVVEEEEDDPREGG
jgi:hypothetical protein